MNSPIEANNASYHFQGLATSTNATPPTLPLRRGRAFSPPSNTNERLPSFFSSLDLNSSPERTAQTDRAFHPGLFLPRASPESQSEVRTTPTSIPERGLIPRMCWSQLYLTPYFSGVLLPPPAPQLASVSSRQTVEISTAPVNFPDLQEEDELPRSVQLQPRFRYSGTSILTVTRRVRP